MNTLLIILAAYILLVLSAELLAWRLQPNMDGAVTLLIPDGGATIGRVVYAHEFEGALYVSSNHWFRAWYHAALKNRDIEVVTDGIQKSHRVVAVGSDESERVLDDYRMGLLLRALCGFAPRKVLRLDPVP